MANISLLELNTLIQSTLDSNLQPSYWVVAEISDLRENQRGHCYLELIEKNEDEVMARIRANIWAYHYRNLAPWFASMAGQPLKAGMKVLVNCQVQFHPMYGLSLNIRDIDPAFTLGERARRRQEVINKLREEGLLNQNKDLSLPEVPKHIAVISSPTAAGYEDFMDQLVNNTYGYQFEVTLFKAIMQGEEATQSIINEMENVAQKEQFDVLVIIRGGGSQVDLDCFNSYDLAAAIASFPQPVLTGIGHDRDETIADIVAHTMLKTPTAVSEFLISGMIAFEQKLLEFLKTLNFITTERLSRQNQVILNYANRIKSATQRLLLNRDYDLKSKLEKLRNSAARVIANQDAHLVNMNTKISVLDPDKTLQRGYTLTTLNSRIISNFGDLQVDDQIETFSKQHILKSTVTGIKKR